ncbi:hypothetical protein GCM10010215_23740 [Streptomyces virginiae]|uniref:Uncharacterized protein n=1 Tax=Streptomyces virginiae TaxID=1961 RepID=A0ABQ3NWH4_STRVG|nr:hypothetical protein GCM10010215_23740 [Streptomyces virginiae]GHI17114.1 hypothetical protein Scinn_65770 [Streptomyces virginiae]GLV89950.1 hypothetical protein Slala04_14040 [Streptomyces lavendulae subsp. lavendulae]
MLGEGQPAGAVEMAREPADAAQDLERFHVEVRALPPPCRHQSVDLVLHADQCKGSVDVKSLHPEYLDHEYLDIEI